MAARPKAWVCRRWLGEIVGSNPTAGMGVGHEWCVLSGRSLCYELITRLEESYRLWCVVVCDLETLRMRTPWSALNHRAAGKKKSQNKPMYVKVDVFGEIKIINTYSEVEVLR